MTPSTTDIAHAISAPEHNVTANWPLIEDALAHLNVTFPLAKVAALATIGVECPPFHPVTEKYNGDPHVYFQRYDGNHSLGNTQPGDGYKFRGRGYVQITGRWNYGHFGPRVGADLLNDPDLALDPHVSARIFADFFVSRGAAGLAAEQNWTRVRSRINGGLNGLATFTEYITKLKSLFGLGDGYEVTA